jgi:NADPH-dependent curcumin reductase CurA
MMTRNNTFVFRSAPRRGFPVTQDNLAIDERWFDLDAEPPDGGFTIANLFFSLDPGLRLRMVSREDRCYTTPFEEGQPIPETTIARVLKSNFYQFQPGDLVIGFTDMEEYSTLSAETAPTFRSITNPHYLPLLTFLGPLGIPGLTAYSSLFAIGKPKPGETIYISAAAGGVGQVVGQLARLAGLRVIGSVGSDEKLEMIKTVLKFHDGFNYKKEAAGDALKRLAPAGIDIFYDNVGGEALDAALQNMKHYGRISKCIHLADVIDMLTCYEVSCGSVSQYSTDQPAQYRVSNLLEIPARRLTMQGFIVFDHDMLLWSDEHRTQVESWLASGEMVSLEHVVVGMEKAVEAFLGVLSGANIGKAVLQVSKTCLKQAVHP